MRGVLVLAVVISLLGCGPTSRVVAPFSLEQSTEAGGYPVVQVGPTGTVLRFLPNVRFGLGLILRNTSKKTVELVDVRTVDPPGSLVQDIGTSLRVWNPPVCGGTHSCPAIGFLVNQYESVTPQAVEVKPGKQAAVQLNFRMSSCAAVPLASHAVAQQLIATYRVRGGKPAQQVIPLAGERLRLRFPSKRDCQSRPKSDITVTAPFAASSTWTIPTSSGDSCSQTKRGALQFTSRLYQAPNGPPARIEIRLPRYHGNGLYRSIGRPARALGPARVSAVLGIGITGWRTFHSTNAVVTVISATTKAVKGRFRATFTGRRRPEIFRAYGAWRCLVT